MSADVDLWSACIRLKGSHHLSVFMYSFSERCSIPSLYPHLYLCNGDGEPRPRCVSMNATCSQ